MATTQVQDPKSPSPSKPSRDSNSAVGHSQDGASSTAINVASTSASATAGNVFIDPEEYSIRKRIPRKFPKQKHHIYVNRKTDSKAQLGRAQKLLDVGFSEIYIHGLGAAVNRAINMALQLKQRSHGSLDLAINTTTMELMDDLEPEQDDLEAKTLTRNNSAVHIKVYRLDPLAKFDNKEKEDMDVS